MSSRTAAWGQPPVSIARMREGARALCRVRNSASSLFGRGLLACAGGYSGSPRDSELVGLGMELRWWGVIAKAIAGS
jgi:hypothetical protein